MGKTFKEKACVHFGVPPERYAETLLRLTLYPHARWLRLVGSRSMLAPDRMFVAQVGRLTRWRGFSGVAREFQHDAQNRLFWRRSLRLRISVFRMRVLFSEVWGEPVPAAGAKRPALIDGSSLVTH